MSNIGSIANIGLVRSKYCPNPTAERFIEALVVAVPGTPAIPTELIVITSSDITKKLKLIGFPVIFATIIINIPGNIPAHPFIPVVAPKLATNVEVDEFAPSESRVSRVTGIHPRLDLDVNASISGNSLNITATGVGNAEITLTKSDSKYNSPPVVYFKENTQDVMRVGSYDPISFKINLKVVGGRVEIIKKDIDNGNTTPQGEATLKGAVYGVYDATNDELITTLTTDENSYAISGYLPKLGKFYLKEITPSLGYTLDTQKYEFTIDEDTLLVNVNVFEEVIKRNFEFTKVYATDKTEIMTPEVGAKFAVYNSNGEKVFEDGQVIKSIEEFLVSYEDMLNISKISKMIINLIHDEPTISKFPSIINQQYLWNITVQNNLITVVSYVDHRSEKGGKIRENFKIILKKDGSRYKIVDLIFNGEKSEKIIY